MQSPSDNPRRPWFLAAAGVALLVAGAIAGWSGRQASTERVVREYLLEHPEVLPEAMERLQARETAKALTGVRGALEKPFPGAILGNPQGTVTLVEFTDYACGYCRQSVADVAALVKENPDLRVVVRELPILSPQSAAAARMALAAAEQGKYAAFHDAMFAAGRPDAASIGAAAKAVGLDGARAAGFAAGPSVALEIDHNLELARQLGFNGTPSWVVGDEILSGAVGRERLSHAIENARKKG